MLIGNMQYRLLNTYAEVPSQYVGSVPQYVVKTFAISTWYDVIGSPFGLGGNHDTLIPPVKGSIEVETDKIWSGALAAFIVIISENGPQPNMFLALNLNW